MNSKLYYYFIQNIRLGNSIISNGTVTVVRIRVQYRHTMYPWLCKKGDYWVVWILNSHVHDISTTLTQAPLQRRSFITVTPTKLG